MKQQGQKVSPGATEEAWRVPYKGGDETTVSQQWTQVRFASCTLYCSTAILHGFHYRSVSYAVLLVRLEIHLLGCFAVDCNEVLPPVQSFDIVAFLQP